MYFQTFSRLPVDLNFITLFLAGIEVIKVKMNSVEKTLGFPCFGEHLSCLLLILKDRAHLE